MSEPSTLERTAQTGDRQPAPVADLAEQALFEEARRRRRRRWRYGTAALVLLAAVGAGLGVGFGGGRGPGGAPGSGSGGAAPFAGGSHVPRSALADIGATPKGWAPIPLTGVQVSVPSSWPVLRLANRGCTGAITGVLFLGSLPAPPNVSCVNADNVVSLRRGSGGVPGSGTQVRINGLSVRLSSRGQTQIAYVAGMVVTARGPMANQIVRTITQSPRSVVLGPYTTATPRTWRQVTYAGLRFSVPRHWKVSKSSDGGACGYNISKTSLGLTATLGLGSMSCPAPRSTAGNMTAQPGMRVATWPLPDAAPHARCYAQNGLRICLHPYRVNWPGESTTDYPGILAADIHLPPNPLREAGGRNVDAIELGLSGSGRVPLAILRSLKPAP